MAAPTPTTITNYDGWRGVVRWRAAWGVGNDDLTDTILVDVSGLGPVPARDALKIRSLNVTMNGNYTVNLEWNDVAQGVVNTTTLNTRATWVSGDAFQTKWVTDPGITTITINGVVYTITSVDSTTQITLASDPGDQTGVAYTVDEIFETFTGQADVTNSYVRDYTDGPNRGLTPDKSSATRTGAVGDILLTTSGAASGDELQVLLFFERD